MGTARALIARTTVVLTIAAPWLAFIPPRHELGRALVFAVALAASFHGWGSGLAALVRRRPEPELAVAWGIALVTAFLGSAMAASLHAQLPVLLIGLVLHGVFLGRRFSAASSVLETLLRGECVRWWIVPAILIAAIGGLHVLGAAGGVALRPFDDEGNVLAQVRRLVDTGTLADPIGYARATQLGAGIALGAFGSIAGDLACLRVIDALGFVLLLVLVCRAIGPRDAATSVWAGVVVVTLGLATVVWLDPSPLWLPIALAVALSRTVEPSSAVPAMLMPAGLLAGTLCALRFEWIPFAVLLAAAAWRPREYRSAWMVRAGTIAAAILFVVLPYLLVRVTAWSRVSASVVALVAPHRNLGLSALISLAIATVALPLTAVVFARMPDRVVRWVALAAVASIACIAGQLTESASGLYYGKYVLPILMTAVLIVVVEVARSGRASAFAMVVTSAIVLLGYEPRLARGHKRPIVHYADLVANIAYARVAEPPSASDPDYTKLLSLVPAGRVGVWVVRPERLDYTRHAIVDLRVPRVSRDRARPWQPDTRDSVIRLVRAAKLHYLLIEDDGAAQRYSVENPLAGLLCGDQCLDPLERMLASQHLLGTAGATRLYELR